MDDPLKVLQGLGIWGAVIYLGLSLAKDIVKIILDEYRERQRKLERAEQWKHVSNVTDAFNRMHERNVRFWDRACRALELSAMMASLTPDGQRKVAELARESARDLDASKDGSS